jgi:hypothetical protein
MRQGADSPDRKLSRRNDAMLRIQPGNDVLADTPMVTAPILELKSAMEYPSPLLDINDHQNPEARA